MQRTPFPCVAHLATRLSSFLLFFFSFCGLAIAAGSQRTRSVMRSSFMSAMLDSRSHGCCVCRFPSCTRQTTARCTRGSHVGRWRALTGWTCPPVQASLCTYSVATHRIPPLFVLLRAAFLMMMMCVCVCVCVAASASHRWVEHGANHTHVTFPKKRLTGVHLARRFGLLPPSRTFALPPLARAEVREEDFARWVSAAVHQGSVIQVLFSYNGTLRWRPIFPRTDWHPGLVSVGRGVP